MIKLLLNKIKKARLDLIDLIIILSYWLFSVLLVLSLVGLFNEYWVGGALLIALFFVLVFRRQIKFPKSNLYFFILLPLFFVGLLLFKGYFGGDSLIFWLPWAKEIVLLERMPDFLLNTGTFMNARMPFLPLLFSTFFTFLPFNEIFVAVVPLFFLAATALLLYQWAKEKEIPKQYFFLLTLLFLANPITLKYGWDFHQEALILFFFTAFFYYLEKYERNNNQFYFFLILLSFTMAIASKFIGLFLLLPLVVIFVKKKFSKKYYLYLFIISLPVIFWFIRNYIIYENPVAPFFNELFKGEYYEVIRIINASDRQHMLYMLNFDSIFVRFGFVIENLLLFFPFLLFSLYGFFKEKKLQYIFLILIFSFFLTWFFQAPVAVPRYLYPIVGLLLIYALLGLKYIKSRLFLSFLFFPAILGLLRTKIYSSQDYFIASFEKILNIFLIASRFIYDYKWIIAIGLSLFFYFFLFDNKYCRYLILLIFSSYLIKDSTIQISWLNIWLPILFLIFLILIWNSLSFLKESFLRKLLIVYIVILLFLNSWGLALGSFIANGQFVFPKESYTILPEAAIKIRELEGDNKDFYIYTPIAGYLVWYLDYKVAGPDSPTFHYLTNAKWRRDFTSQEIYSLFKEVNIKYIIESVHRPAWQDTFDKIKKRPDLFRPILEKGSYTMWQVL